MGPVVGTIIILVLLGFGALYFYGEYLNNQNTPDVVPFIPGNA